MVGISNRFVGRFVGVAALAAILGCEAPDPKVVAKANNVRITDGFRVLGGTFITDGHVATVHAIVENAEFLTVTDHTGKTSKAKVVSKSPGGNGGLLAPQDLEAEVGDPGEAVSLTEGVTLTTALFGEAEQSTVVTGEFLGWRYHEGRAYVQASFATTKSDVGAGVFGPDGKLVGLVGFRRGSKLTFVQPVEYLITGEDALKTGPFDKHQVEAREVSEAFAKRLSEAEAHPEPLMATVDFDALLVNPSFSRTALVGELFILEKPDAVAHDRPVTFEIRASNTTGKEWVIGKGTLAAGDQQWHSNDALKSARAAELAGAYGDAYVAENFTPFDYGVIRYRIPFATFCKKVTGDEVHNLILALADGRKTDPIGFADMVNICSAQEDGQGVAWEQEWGMQANASAGAGPAPEAKGKKKGKKGKRKKRKR